ncbi:MAG: glycosyltransferase family 2 protein [Bifidobacteriaceae bacterium]|nr:glycosyltransferase family 2 protein [Bifidobacteriaceae bacterium]
MNKSKYGLFLMPFYANTQKGQLEYLEASVKSIINQTDSKWHLLIIDSGSNNTDAWKTLKKISSDKRITIMLNKENKGVSAVRNQGIKWAAENGYPFILFQDSDDISDSKRLEKCKKIFDENANVDVVFSTFKVIDEEGKLVPRAKIAPSVLEITDQHPKYEKRYDNIWIDIASKIGYTNLTSATTVKTNLALKNPFPEDCSISEDYYTWLSYSASGGIFYFSPNFPSLYRIPQKEKKSGERDCEFYKSKSAVDQRAVLNAISLYRQRFALSEFEIRKILMRFYLKQFYLFMSEDEKDIAIEQIKKIESLSPFRNSFKHIIPKDLISEKITK